MKRSPGRAPAGAGVVAAAAGAAEVKSPNSCRPSRSEEAKEGRAGAGAGAASRPSRSAEAEGRTEGAAEGVVTGRGHRAGLRLGDHWPEEEEGAGGSGGRCVERA